MRQLRPVFAALSAGETPAVPVSDSPYTFKIEVSGPPYCSSDSDEDVSLSGSGHEAVPSVHGMGSLAGKEPSKAASISASLMGLQSGCASVESGCSWSLSISLEGIRQLSPPFGECAPACDIFVFFNHARVAQWIRAFASGAKGRRFDPCRGYQYFQQFKSLVSQTTNPRQLLFELLFAINSAPLGAEPSVTLPF